MRLAYPNGDVPRSSGVYGVPTADVERITGFDEGFKPAWRDEFERRGIHVVGPLCADADKKILSIL